MRLLSRMVLVSLVAAVNACAVGEGTGSVTGSLVVEGCDKDLSSYDMNPDFFGAQSAGDKATGDRQLIIRIQNGADLQEYRDNLVITVDDVYDVATQYGKPIPVAAQRPPGSPLDYPPPKVRMSLGLRGSCGSPKLNPGDPAFFVVLHATSGTITFDHILDPSAPARDTNAKRIEGHFSVTLEDPRFPLAKGGKNGGTLTGDFKFFYQRGGPAQPFP